MKKETIIYGTAILITTNLAVKVMSLVYRGILIRLIGAEGLGLTELMMPLFSFLLVIASLGVPLAISNFISAEQKMDRIMSILKTGTVLLLFNSLIVGVIICLLFPFTKNLIFTDNRIIPGFFALIPSIFIISVFSALRGYFQGSHRSSIIGKSQVVEQLMRIFCGIAIVLILLSKDYSLSIILVGLSIATFIAELCGGFYLLFRYKRDKPPKTGRFEGNVAVRMFKTGTPITLSRVVATLTVTFQAILIPRALIAGGATLSEAATFFGLFSGVALTVLHLPAVITGALVTPLIPAIVAADSQHKKTLLNSRIAKSLCFTTFTALPILTLLYYYATPICNILFASPEAGPMLSLLCLGGIFIYLQHPVIAVLQGLNRFRRIFINYCIADSIYIIALFLLGKSSYFSVQSLIFIFILNDVLMFFLHYIYMKRITGCRIAFTKTYLLPFIACLAGLLLMLPFEKYIMQTNITEMLSMTLSACVFVIVYFFTLMISGAFDKNTIKGLLSSKRHR
jgi:stage V sporulation protein B